jgi:hypothetical protein
MRISFVSITYIVTASDIIQFTQQSLSSISARRVGHSLSFSQKVTFVKTPKILSLTDYITFIDTAIVRPISHPTFKDIIIFNQNITVKAPSHIAISLVDNITFIDKVTDIHSSNISLVNTITFNQNVISAHKYSRSLSDNITFNENIIKATDIEILDRLILLQYLSVYKPLISNDILTFTETLTLSHINSPFYDTLIFNELLSYNSTTNYLFDDVITLIDKCNVISSNSYDVLNPITIISAQFVTFTVISTGLTFTIFPPALDDTWKSDSGRIVRETRGGDVIVFADHHYPTFDTLKMKFIFANYKEANNFQLFCEQNLGLEMLYVDYEGITWDGVITSPDFDIIEVGPINFEFEITFETIGVVVS